VLAHIDELIAEEHTLRAQAAAQGLDEKERARLQELEVQLDQCWDLLRQRRARAEFGQDPDGAQTRPADQVEHYRS
jgi:uncharacterized protein DUF2630